MTYADSGGLVHVFPESGTPRDIRRRKFMIIKQASHGGADGSWLSSQVIEQ